MTHATLGEALDEVQREMQTYQVELDEEATRDLSDRYAFGGICYGEVKRADVPIAKLKGKATRKWFHVVIERFDHNGRYEVVCYPL